MKKEEKEISQRVRKILELIETKEHSKKELINYFNNIMENSIITDWEREVLTKAVEKEMRTKFPNSAKKILGAKSAKAQELLEEIYSSLEKEFNWSENCVGSKVKVGGSMIAGREYVCWYMSYKNDEGYSAGLHYRQKTPEDDPYLEVDYRKVGKEFEKDREVKIFPVELKEDALDLYRNFLSKTIK